MTPAELRDDLSNTAFAFRGYNVTNLGKSPELLAHPIYRDIVIDHLRQAESVAREVTGRPMDLVRRVENRQETDLESYADAVALIVAMEHAQLQCLKEFFDVDFANAKLALGYSLGEISAVAACGVFRWQDGLRVPLALADDTAALAHEVTLGVLFSREKLIPMDVVQTLCLRVNQQGKGVLGISARLSPNSVLLMGQGDTLDRFKKLMEAELPPQTHLRKNSQQFPPMHTPIVWQKNISCRAATLMQTMPGGLVAPKPPVLSLVTGGLDYNHWNARDILHRWTDHPQLLWKVVHETLARNVEVVVHVGPEPNLIPATYKRISDNVEAVTKAGIGMRAMQAVASQSWLSAVLPESAVLLRAPFVNHVILEDWLLEHAPASKNGNAAATK